jgi:hypothetical protein
VDWHGWHDDYDRQGSPLARRLEAVQVQVKAVLDGAPASVGHTASGTRPLKPSPTGRFDEEFPFYVGSTTFQRRGSFRTGESFSNPWGTAIYVASTDSYEDQIWFSGSIEETFDLVCDLHLTNAGQ